MFIFNHGKDNVAIFTSFMFIYLKESYRVVHAVKQIGQDWVTGHTPAESTPHSLLLYFHAKLYSVHNELFVHEMIASNSIFICHKHQICKSYHALDENMRNLYSGWNYLASLELP